MKKQLFILLFFGAMAQILPAQEAVYQVDEITVINYGDGRLLFRKQGESKEPLGGVHRIIDGYHSEYLIAGFKNGMYDGKYQHFKRNNLWEESTYKDGRLHGVWKEYYSDGKVKSVEERSLGGSWEKLESYDREGKSTM